MNARERLKRKLAGKKAVTKVPSTTKKQPCVKCGNATQSFHEILKVYACQDCTKEHRDLELISKAVAMKEFHATETDLGHFRHCEKKGQKGNVVYFLRRDVEHYMIKKYGSKEAFEAILAQKKLNATDKEALEAPTKLPEVISFSTHRAKTYGCFSNLSSHGFELQDKYWPSVTHYFEAQKYAGRPLEEIIRKTADPAKAKKMGSSPDHPIRDDWDFVKDDIMYEAVLAKFRQNRDIRRILLATENVPIVEHTASDNYWGDGGDGSGRNQLGKTLVVVRGKLRREEEAKKMQRKRKRKSREDDDDEENEEAEEKNGQEKKKDKGKEKEKERSKEKKRRKAKEKEEEEKKKPAFDEWDVSKLL